MLHYILPSISERLCITRAHRRTAKTLNFQSRMTALSTEDDTINSQLQQDQEDNTKLNAQNDNNNPLILKYFIIEYVNETNNKSLKIIPSTKSMKIRTTRMTKKGRGR